LNVTDTGKHHAGWFNIDHGITFSILWAKTRTKAEIHATNKSHLPKYGLSGMLFYNKKAPPSGHETTLQGG
jgi:hypothetical protein